MSEVKKIVRLVIIQVVLTDFHDTSMQCLELDVHKVKCPNGVSNQYSKEIYIYSIIIETTYTRLGAIHIY